jgi:hypothetical protein
MDSAACRRSAVSPVLFVRCTEPRLLLVGQHIVEAIERRADDINRAGHSLDPLLHRVQAPGGRENDIGRAGVFYRLRGPDRGIGEVIEPGTLEASTRS